ncbi:hypothetical protein [Streptomyces erythrochromogenes]|uniref:hypothetical protein n=1 Tax=Streptomyces erythrochromogenes TaxID=285574 RepID=UPI00030EBCAC
MPETGPGGAGNAVARTASHLAVHALRADRKHTAALFGGRTSRPGPDRPPLLLLGDVLDLTPGHPA